MDRSSPRRAQHGIPFTDEIQNLSAVLSEINVSVDNPNSSITMYQVTEDGTQSFSNHSRVFHKMLGTGTCSIVYTADHNLCLFAVLLKALQINFCCILLVQFCVKRLY